MYSDTDKTALLPEEIYLYKRNNQSETDPIKKGIFSFSELTYIMNNVISFPVNAEEYYRIKYESEDEKKLPKLLALCYLGYRNYNENNLIKKIDVEPEDLLLTIDFVDKLFNCNNPVINSENEESIWIFPKFEIKKFISNCITKNYFDEYYYDDLTLEKLIVIITGFVNYEYSNADSNIIKQISELNYPTLILANIGLYEKGIIRIQDEENGIGISLDLHPRKVYKEIFTKDINRLKEKILKIVNEMKNNIYTMNDFLS